MKNIYNLKCYDFEGYDNNIYISSDLEPVDFKILLVKLNKISLQDDDLVSKQGHYDNIIVMLEKEGHKMVYFYDDTYVLDDNCPVSNSSFWKRSRTEWEKL